MEGKNELGKGCWSSRCFFIVYLLPPLKISSRTHSLHMSICLKFPCHDAEAVCVKQPLAWYWFLSVLDKVQTVVKKSFETSLHSDWDLSVHSNPPVFFYICHYWFKVLSVARMSVNAGQPPTALTIKRYSAYAAIQEVAAWNSFYYLGLIDFPCICL